MTAEGETVELTTTGQTSIVAGTEIKVVTEREELSLALSQLDEGSRLSVYTDMRCECSGFRNSP